MIVHILQNKTLCFLAVMIVFGSASMAACQMPEKQIPKTLVLSYEELGPQVVAYELIGKDWYQWNPHGDSDPSKVDDIKVVVYRNIPLTEVKKMYPVSEENKADYRYLEYVAAIEYLDKYKDDPLLEHLWKTKKKIIETLGIPTLD